MKKYKVTGMSCAACQTRVEKAVSGVEGVSSCSVSLLTNTMGVEGTAKDSDIIKAVRAAGYGAGVLEDDDYLPSGEEELRAMKIRLISSVIILLILMYFSMGHMMLGFPVPEILHNGVYMGILQAVLTLAVMIINRKYFISGFRALIRLSPNMDTLIATGSGAAFVYSMAVLITGGSGDYYFESASMILTLVTVGKTLEQYSKGKTTNALKSLMKLSPDRCTVVRDGAECEIPVSELMAGDIVAVRPGESFPSDGVIIDGSTSADESLVTGESIPVDKAEGDGVISASVNLTGYVKYRATRVGKETTLSQIIAMVSEAAATKAPIARLADRISSVFVPAVMGIAAVTFAVWMILGQTLPFSLARAISVLVVSCPCALGLATPVAIMVGSGLGARHGILFKTAGALQETGKVRIAALDKTGTVTEGKMSVEKIRPAEGVSEADLVRLAKAVEQGSEHPIGKAVSRFEYDAAIPDIRDFKAHSGHGVSCSAEGRMIYGGNRDFVSSVCEVTDGDEAGRVFFASEGEYLGCIDIFDGIKPDSKKAIGQLRDMGIFTVLLTGDSETAAEKTGKISGVQKVIGKVTPGGKADVIRQLKAKGKCLMTGDGINDAPALTEADCGVAIGAGTDVAIDSADIVLMSGSLLDLAAAVRLSRRVYRNILENLFWALFYNVLLIPAACGVYAGLGITMTPGLGALAMSLSSICVVLNALRLNLTDIYDPRRDRKKGGVIEDIEITVKEDKKMTRTMKINGMMCGHCEARVKKALEAVDGVESAVVSHEQGTAVVTAADTVSDEVLTKAVTDQDYEVVSIS